MLAQAADFVRSIATHGAVESMRITDEYLEATICYRNGHVHLDIAGIWSPVDELFEFSVSSGREHHLVFVPEPYAMDDIFACMRRTASAAADMADRR